LKIMELKTKDKPTIANEIAALMTFATRIESK
jgi:hypothetical protein